MPSFETSATDHSTEQPPLIVLRGRRLRDRERRVPGPAPDAPTRDGGPDATTGRERP